MAVVSRRTRTTCEEVFAVLENGWLYPSWVVGASRARDVDPAWPRQGSRLHHSIGLWPVLVDDITEVVAAEPPHRLVLSAKGRPALEAVVEIELKPAPGGGCVITLHEEVRRGPGRIFPRPPREALLRWRNRETLRRLALIAEGTVRGRRQGESPGRP